MPPTISSSDVLAYLQEYCAEVIRRTGCGCAAVSAHARLGDADAVYFVVHADDVCIYNDSLREAMSEALENYGTPAWRAAHLRAEATQLLERANKLAPAKGVA